MFGSDLRNARVWRTHSLFLFLSLRCCVVPPFFLSLSLRFFYKLILRCKNSLFWVYRYTCCVTHFGLYYKGGLVCNVQPFKQGLREVYEYTPHWIIISYEVQRESVASLITDWHVCIVWDNLWCIWMKFSNLLSFYNYFFYCIIL